MNRVSPPELKQSLFQPEGAHEDSSIEWWFFQGHYEATPGDSRFFMVTLFRYRLERSCVAPSHCFQLLLSLFNQHDKSNHVATWVDQAAPGRAVEKLAEHDGHVDREVQQAWTEELKEHGPPHPIRLVNAPQHFDSSPLCIQWNSFELKQDGEGFRLAFCDPHDRRGIAMQLKATAPRLDIACGPGELPLTDGMFYHCYPRLELSGFLESGEPIQGTAWHDHQWGGTGWVGDVDGVLGWDWFGINLDDGTDVLVMLHRDAKTGHVLAQHATLRNSVGVLLSTDDFLLHPLRFWESPATRIQHPIEWEIRIPCWNARLRFQPLADDQEVPCFGTMRAIWQGAGWVCGEIADQPVKGRARGEFYGYGYLFDFQIYLDRLSNTVDRSLEKYFPREFEESAVERMVGRATWKHEPEAFTEMIARPVWDLIDRSGKRWRPAFGLLMLEALGTVSHPYTDLICNFAELIHTGALIVDDIEDESQLRRGQPCLHLRYGTDVALNAGNLLYFLPTLLLLDHPRLSPEKRLLLLAIWERTMLSAHGGQTVDIFWSRKMGQEQLTEWLRDDLEDRILQMYAMKTGAGVVGLAEFAAIIADADEKTKAACINFARDFAVAFQIVDDIHNFNRSPGWTKVCGEDLTNGKLTYVIAIALRSLDVKRSNRLRDILCCRSLRNDSQSLGEGTDLIHQSGALDLCREKACSLAQQSWQQFSQRIRPSESKIMLRVMSRKLLDLAFDT